MRIFRLARLFETKYQLYSISSNESINSLKQNIIDAYNNYVNSKTAKEPVLQMLADVGEPFSKKLIVLMEDVVINIDDSLENLFTKVNSILELIQSVKEDPKKTVRNFIHDSIRATKQSEKNYREHVKSKFEVVVFQRLASILEKQARILKKIVLSQEPIKGHSFEPIRKELSKQKILNFLRTPIADKYGLDSLDTWEKISSYPELKEKLITLINAIDRGHFPIDGYEVTQAVADIMTEFRDRASKNNSALFEGE